MGTLNKIVNVVLLVLAVAAAVFSFLLFQKREVFVNGWSKLTAAISSTAKEMDKESGTQVAAKLSPDNLDYKNYEQLDASLSVLKKQAADITKQRNDLASALVTSANSLEVKAPDVNSLKNVEQYTNKKDEFLSLASKAKEKNAALAHQIAVSGAQFGAPVNENSLKSIDAYKPQLDVFTQKLTSVKNREAAYTDVLKNIASAVGAKAPPADETYAPVVKDIAANVVKLKSDYTVAVKERDTIQKQYTELSSKLNEKDKEILAGQHQLADRDALIAQLKGDITKLTATESGSGAPEQIKMLQSGDPSNLKYVKGKVLEVSKKWDFVVIDLGAIAKIEQKINNKTVTVNVAIPQDEELYVARKLDGNSSEYVGKLKIIKIYDNSAIANIVPTPMLKGRIQAGDLVFFSDDTVKKLVDAAGKAREKAASTVAAPKTEATVE